MMKPVRSLALAGLLVIGFSVVTPPASAQQLKNSAAQRREARLQRGTTTRPVTPRPTPQVPAQSPPQLGRLATEEDLRVDAVAKADPAVVSVLAVREGRSGGEEVSGGTAFFVSADGLLMTNSHVVMDSESEFWVRLPNGRASKATVVSRDGKHDVALLQVDETGMPFLTLAPDGDIKLAQTVIVIGNALGEYRNTVSVGVVSGLGRSVTARDQSGHTEILSEVLQTDAAINRGVSGGPLLNLKGQVIGMSTAVVTQAQSIGFAIPSHILRRTLEAYTR